MAEKNEDAVSTCSIAEFCKRAGIYKAELARRMDVEKQQVSNWEKVDYFVRYNTETGDVQVIRAEKLIKKCICKEVIAP